MTRPLAIDLFCGLGGWTDGLLAEGYDVIGFDIERHLYGEHLYPAQLVIQDVLTLHGSQFKSAALIVASPPCQEYSYMAMPWKRAKALAADYRSGKRDVKQLTALFDACFRIQREACEAAGRHIPLIVENVKGAQPWVGHARANFGSFYLWGDVPVPQPGLFGDERRQSLMPLAVKGRKNNGGSWFNTGSPGQKVLGQNPDGRKVPGFRFDGSGRSFQTASVETTGHKSQGMNWSDRTKHGQDFTRVAGKQIAEGRKFTIRRPGDKTTPRDPVASAHGPARKAASAMIAKIPLPLSRHIAATFARAG